MNKTLWVIIGLAVVLVIGVGMYFMKANQTATAPTDQKTQPAGTATKADTKSVWTVGGVAVKGTFADADTVKLAANSYRMYYGIRPEVKGNKFEIFSATSTDGKSWTQEAGERKTMATFPEVVKLADGSFRMYFQQAGVIKSAKSADGLKFTDEAGTRIDKTNDLNLTFDNVAAPTVILQADGTFMMVYRGIINEQYGTEPTPNKNTQLLLWATSPDGLTWTKKGIAIDSRNTTLNGLTDGPELFVSQDGTTKLSYWSYTGVYWSAVTDGAFGDPEKIFSLAESTVGNKFPAKTAGDPTYAEFNNVWYMYYGQPDGIHYATAM